MDDSKNVVRDNPEVKISIKICVRYRRTFIDSYIIWTSYSDLKHNSHKGKNPLLSLKHINSYINVAWDIKKTQKFKVKLLGCFPLNYKCYIQEKIPWIEANYEHYFRIKIVLLTIPSWKNNRCLTNINWCLINMDTVINSTSNADISKNTQNIFSK